MTKYDTKGAFAKLKEDPFLPAAPAPRKSRKGWYVAGAIVLALGIGGTLSESENATSTPAPVDTVQVDEPIQVDEPTDLGVTPEMIVDAMGPAQEANFCNLSAQLGDYDAGLNAFTDGYGTSQNPSAQEVYDEFLSRC
jgi:hypothetical protein